MLFQIVSLKLYVSNIRNALIYQLNNIISYKVTWLTDIGVLTNKVSFTDTSG